MTTSPLFSLINQERERQEQCIDLIASENYTSQNIMNITGSVLTNKYAEGYPGRRYYAGCQIIDEIENYAISLGKKLFGADHLNVQSHSGSNANSAAYLSCLQPGDTVLAMSLSMGGHLTHGHKVNFSGKLYNFVHYGVSRETEQIDYAQVAQLAAQHKPKLLVAGTSAYSRLIDYQLLKTIAQEHGALFMYDMAHISGLVAANVIPSPFPYADIVTSTTHKTLRGPRGGMIGCTQNLAQKIDQAVMPGSQGGPLMHVIAAKAACFEEALTPEFIQYQKDTLANAKIMAQTFQDLGYRVIAGGTDTHLLLIDVSAMPHGKQSLNGKVAEEILEQCNIILNRNSIPFDTASPFTPSGIRIGTPAITTRGFGAEEVVALTHLIHDVLTHPDDTQLHKAVKEEVRRLCAKFPVYNAAPICTEKTAQSNQASVS